MADHHTIISSDSESESDGGMQLDPRDDGIEIMRYVDEELDEGMSNLFLTPSPYAGLLLRIRAPTILSTDPRAQFYLTERRNLTNQIRLILFHRS
jgi:hypothetical protein